MSYRPNVAAIVRKPQTGEILICERKDYPGNWQFPQGGVKSGEDLEDALYRELKEEVALDREDVTLVARRSGYQYLFPKGAKKKGWLGQDQTYFLVDLLPDREARVSIDTEKPEFRDFRWIQPGDFELNWLPEVKQNTYQQVIRDFFEVDVAISSQTPYSKGL